LSPGFGWGSFVIPRNPCRIVNAVSHQHPAFSIEAES
jgi:hypothetical protein